MIHPNEYRVGNYLLDNGRHNRIFQFGGLEANEEYTEWKYIHWMIPFPAYSRINEVEPILLVGQWLLKFGFSNPEYSNSWWMIDGFDGVIKKFNDKYYLSIGGEDVRELEFVHQLQNIYFAITDNELTVNENQNAN